MPRKNPPTVEELHEMETDLGIALDFVGALLNGRKRIWSEEDLRNFWLLKNRTSYVLRKVMLLGG